MSAPLKQGPLALHKTHLPRANLLSRKQQYLYHRLHLSTPPQNTDNEIALRHFVTIAFNW